MAQTVLTYSPAYTNGGTNTFDWSGATFTSTDLGLTYTGSPVIFDNSVPNNVNLTGVTIGNTVISIGDFVFISCTGLTSVTIPATVTSIGNSAFGDCTRLINIVVNSYISNFGSVFPGVNNAGLQITFD